jgi:hypothetical protein
MMRRLRVRTRSTACLDITPTATCTRHLLAGTSLGWDREDGSGSASAAVDCGGGCGGGGCRLASASSRARA